MRIRNVSIITFEPKLTLRLFFTIPLAFVIRLFTWGSESHVALFFSGRVREEIGAGFNQIPMKKKLSLVPDNESVYIREPKNFFDDKVIKELKEFCKTQEGMKYGVGAAIFTALNWIPFLNKINFGRKKSACSIFVCKSMKIAGVLDDHVDPYNTNPRELIRRIDKSGLYEKKRLIKK